MYAPRDSPPTSLALGENHSATVGVLVVRRNPPMRPRLRPIEIIRVPSGRGDLVTVLRDPERIAPHAIEVRAPLDAALAYLDGRHSVAEIARLLAQRGSRIGVLDVERLVADLEQAAMLEGPTARARKDALVRAFAASRVRPATHAGGAYHGEAAALAAYVEDECLGVAPKANGRGKILGLVAPHMDLWRAAGGYGRSYGALRGSLPDRVDTIVVLGTCHAGLHSTFCLTRKAFATPLGDLDVDDGFVSELAEASDEDVFAEEYKHKGEHSIEFQCVFLRYLLGDERARAVRIVPILCGLGRSQIDRSDPGEDPVAERFLGALGDGLAKRSGRALVVAGADLAHVGPRFGDKKPLDGRGRARLEERDRASLDLAVGRDPGGFFDHVTEDLASRRVCGTGPLYTLLRALEGLGVRNGELLSYEQNIDPDEGSIVSHASVVFT
ncbi:MAG: AmmeMemoRadiSam system protein B [Polyangiaceae bacterium]|nr:AmmeMemoRadiSam system protein B [Polyangiaceae bacterium]